ncbi:NADPH-dependent ferric siderophore reductase [Catenuloplanes nepalensis]|uniref:NADPH-dependent ferric siderophore reductase n=1 Tax=Catenuloplanes nepalensis TaxID=587533 RepID=A0ABT9MUB3_9ACTN|nr:hypothetical protein [Catenuloplanes nepalensis]MDP9794959.1 NADPH-dependent ferric siderophore reductase [Catenuloplanes nepalensis]
MIPKVYPPGTRTIITLGVRRREFLSPSFASVTLGGPGVGVPKQDTSFFGYWRLGRSAPG